MTAIRIDGGGTRYDDERIIKVSKILQSIPYIKNKVLKITDYKGKLIVLWDNEPSLNESSLIDNLWIMFDEYLTEHKTLEI